MSAMTNTLGNFYLNYTISNGNTYWVCLFTADPTTLGSFSNEVVGGSYARQSTTFPTASNKTTGNAAVLLFDNMPACTVSHVGICWSETGTTNDLLFYAPLSLVVASGKTVRMEINDLVVTL